MPPWSSAGFQKWPVYGTARVNNSWRSLSRPRFAVAGEAVARGYGDYGGASDATAVGDGRAGASFARVAAYVSLAPAERANEQVRVLRRVALAKGLATRHWPDHACVLAGTGGVVDPSVMEDASVLGLVG